MAIKLGRMITYPDELLSIKSLTFWSRCLVRSHDRLNWLYLHYHSVCGHHMWQDGNLPWWALNMALWLHGVVRSRDNLKSYLHYHSACDHNTRQDGDLPWGVSTHNFTRPIGCWACDLERSHDKLKPLYLHYHSTCDHNPRQDGDLPRLP